MKYFGRIDEAHGEYAHTEFGAFLGVPFLPLDAEWVAGETKFLIAWQWRSVGSVYLRWYGWLVAALCVWRFPLVVGVPIAVAIALATVWTLRWRRARGPRRAWNVLAFGTRCEPAQMHVELRTFLANDLRKQWVARDLPRTAADTARDGTADLDEALLAYGLLALELDPAANRLLASPPAGLETRAAPPWPEQAESQALTGSLNAYVRKGAARLAWVAGGCAFCCLFGLGYCVPDIGEPAPVHVADALADPPSGLVVIACDTTTRAGSTDVQNHPRHLWRCADMMELAAISVTHLGDTELPNPVIGRLHSSDDEKLKPVYLEETAPQNGWMVAGVCGGFGLLAVLFGVLTVRKYRRERHLPRERDED
jgi:hypothetical protein